MNGYYPLEDPKTVWLLLVLVGGTTVVLFLDAVYLFSGMYHVLHISKKAHRVVCSAGCAMGILALTLVYVTLIHKAVYACTVALGQETLTLHVLFPQKDVNVPFSGIDSFSTEHRVSPRYQSHTRILHLYFRDGRHFQSVGVEDAKSGGVHPLRRLNDTIPFVVDFFIKRVLGVGTHPEIYAQNLDHLVHLLESHRIPLRDSTGDTLQKDTLDDS